MHRILLLLATHGVKLANQGVQATIELMRRWGIPTAHRAHNDTVLLLGVCPLKVCIWRFHHLLLLLGGIEFTTAQRSNLLHGTAVVGGLLG